jgi:hypothetical protein
MAALFPNTALGVAVHFISRNSILAYPNRTDSTTEGSGIDSENTTCENNDSHADIEVGW